MKQWKFDEIPFLSNSMFCDWKISPEFYILLKFKAKSSDYLKAQINCMGFPLILLNNEFFLV